MAVPIAVFAAAELDQHATPAGHPERHGRLDAALAGIPAAGLHDAVRFVEPRLATVDELVRVHDADYVEAIERFCVEGGGGLDPDTYAGPGSWTTARRAAGAVLDAVDALEAGDCDVAFAAGRPPGHHAVVDRAMGFCLFNNAAVAAAALAERGERVAIVDWDVHHGNGTQDIFYDDGDVLTISIHQNGLYPSDSGFLTEVGEGAGEGYNINVPMPAGSGGDAHRAALAEVALPAVQRFDPDLILVGCGYDASMYDPMARQMLTASTFGDLMTMTMEVADGVCDGRLVAVHEGGYSPEYVPFCGLAVLERMSGHRTEVTDPFEKTVLRIPGQEMTVLQRACIDAARDVRSL